MATYTVQSTVEARMEYDPGQGDAQSVFWLDVHVLEDGVEIGQKQFYINTDATNQEIRLQILGEIREIVNLHLLAQEQATLDARAATIQNALDNWERTV